MVKKFIFTPLYKIEDTEQRLSDYEAEGLRIKKSKWKHFYYFDEAQAKSMRYFLCWSLGREDTMSVWEMNLASQHKAQKIHESLGYSIFRTSQSEEELFFLKATRADYIKSALMKILLIKLFFFIVLLVCTVLAQQDDRMILLCGLILLGISILYTSFCLIKQMRLCKKYNEMIRT